jgi:hypothetical protein
MVSFEARPTEYKGTVYRSKCEAMFARWLELRWSKEGDPFGIIYEPESLRTKDGWVPDFLVWSVQHVDCGCPDLHFVSYEYKPSKPTKTYLKDFYRRTQEVDSFYPRYVQHQLYYGSVFNNARGYCFGGSRISDYQKLRCYDWLGDFENIIKETRFDLEAQHG